MRGDISRWPRLGLTCVLFVVAVSNSLNLVPAPSARGDEPATAIASYLDAGEYGPALDVARSVGDVGVRDRWLGRIATAQADAGAWRASMATLADIRGDVARSQVVDSLGRRPIGSAGGAAYADFDTLIELITATIAPETWDEVGGAGAIESFPTGVFVDASGVLKRLGPARDVALLEGVRAGALEDSGNRTVRSPAVLRKVSLVRLEKQLQLRHAFGRRPSEAMRLLGGLYRIKYLLVYPATGDIVLAGPAGDWRTDSEGRVVNVETGIPVLQLDDLVAVLRNAFDHRGQFGCVIKPRQENLAATKAYVDRWRGKALKPHQREGWLAGLRRSLGKQDIGVWGLDPRTHAARILVEADYRMKLVGMGLEEGTLGVVSYMEAVKQSSRDRAASMSVLRWWFTLDYAGVRTTKGRDAFEFDGQGVKLLSENELLTETGKRIHTGRSDELNSQFARSFTRRFDALASKYPIYAELRNVFDMALVAALIRSEDLPNQVDWHMTHFGDSDAYRVALGREPKEVDSVINWTEISRSRIIAHVSGGVAVDTNDLVKQTAIEVDDYGLMEATRGSAAPAERKVARDQWWWD